MGIISRWRRETHDKFVRRGQVSRVEAKDLCGRLLGHKCGVTPWKALDTIIKAFKLDLTSEVTVTQFSF